MSLDFFQARRERISRTGDLDAGIELNDPTTNHNHLDLWKTEGTNAKRYIQPPSGTHRAAKNAWAGSTRLASIIELLTILLTSFALNLVPFASPSNLFIASNAALFSTADPVSIGFLVAFGAATAKLVHYVLTFFVGAHLGEQRRKRLDAVAPRLRRWGFVALFAVAATPLPDEPVVIPLGLLKYNPAKFYVAYFAGKLSITVAGAYLGRFSEDLLASTTSQEVLMIISIILTMSTTVILLKVDVAKIARKIFRRKTKTDQ